MQRLLELRPAPSSVDACDWETASQLRGRPIPEEIVNLGNTYGSSEFPASHKLIVPVEGYYYDLRDWIEITIDMYQSLVEDGCRFRYPTTDSKQYLPWLVDGQATFSYIWQRSDDTQLVVCHSWESFWMAEYSGGPTELLIELAQEGKSLTEFMIDRDAYYPE